MRRAMLIVAALLTFAAPARAADPYADLIQPYVGRGAFSGAILVVKDGSVVFDRAYGAADAERHLPNQTTTRFHVGTLSMLYTAAAVLRLVEQGRLNLDHTAGQFVPGLDATQAGQSVQQLLGVAADAPDAIQNYTLLARIAAAAGGRTFADTADHTVFASVLLTGSGLDDGTLGGDTRLAKGYRADGTPAPVPDWAALTGAASAFTTTRGAYHWLDMLFDGDLLTAPSRALLFNGPLQTITLSGPQGIVPGYRAAGRVEGFSSCIVRFPKATVVVLANVETPNAGKVAALLAAMAAGVVPESP